MFGRLIQLLGLLSWTNQVLASSDPVADKRCVDSNGPGWEAQLDASGKAVRCQKIISQDDCFPDWLNPHTGKYECCPVGTTLASDQNSGVSACCGTGQALRIDAKSKTGACCDQGLHWSYDATSRKGTCCQSGYDFDGIHCIVNPPASTTGQPPPSTPAPSPSPKPTTSVPVPPVSSQTSSSSDTPKPNTSAQTPTSTTQSMPSGSSHPTTDKNISAPQKTPTQTQESQTLASSSSSSIASSVVSSRTDDRFSPTTGHQQTSSTSANPIPSGTSGASLQIGDCTLSCPGSTLPIGFCSPGSSATSSGLGSPSPIPSGGVGPQGPGSPGTSTDQLPLLPGGASQFANPNNYFNNTCRGLQLGVWNYWDTGNPVINTGKRYYMPVPGGKLDKKPDASQYRFPVDTWFFIVSVYTLNEQAQLRVYVDDQVVGVTSPLTPPKGKVDCRDGITFERCLLPDDDHSRGLFFVPAGTRSVSVESIAGDTSLLYYATRFDSVCSNLTPCQGPEVTKWTRFNTVPIQTQPFWSTTYSTAVKNESDTLLTIVDSVYPSSQWTVYLDGKVILGSLNRPVYLTEDKFLNDAVFQDTVPEYPFAWGAYWRVFLIPKGEHLVEWRVTGGKRTKNDGTLWDQYSGHYKVNQVCTT